MSGDIQVDGVTYRLARNYGKETIHLGPRRVGEWHTNGVVYLGPCRVGTAHTPQAAVELIHRARTGGK